MSQYGDDGEKTPRPRRSFTPEFKADIVERCLADDPSINQVAHDFDLTVSAVRGWVRQAEIDADTRDGLTTEEKEELSRLREITAEVQRGHRLRLPRWSPRRRPSAVSDLLASVLLIEQYCATSTT
jgi:transposase